MNFGRQLTILSPLVLPSNLFLFFGSEVVCDIKGLSDLLGRLALDHVRDGLASNIKQGFDVEVVRRLQKYVSFHFESRGIKDTYKDDLEQHLLVDLHELLVPLLDIGGLFAGIGVVVDGGRRIILVVLAPLNDLLQNGLIDLTECQQNVRR